MQLTIYMCIPNIQGFLNEYDFFLELWSLHPLPWQPKQIFNLSFKDFSLAQPYHYINREKYNAKISA